MFFKHLKQSAEPALDANVLCRPEVVFCGACLPWLCLPVPGLYHRHGIPIKRLETGFCLKYPFHLHLDKAIFIYFYVPLFKLFVGPLTLHSIQLGPASGSFDGVVRLQP